MTAEAPEITAATLILRVQEGSGHPCAGCHAPLVPADVLMSSAMGFKSRPHCLACLARELGQELADLRERLLDYFAQRDCYRGAWEWIQQRDGLAVGPRPGHGLPDPAASPAGARAEAVDHHAEWNAGDLGCGELVLELRMRMHQLAPRQIMKLTARDPGVPADLPAWCGLIGHRLVRAQHPDYWIERKD